MQNNLKTQEIAFLNDLCRKLPGLNGRWIITAGIGVLPKDEQKAILGKVTNFDAFTADNNPHGERDFGSFTHNGNMIFWKIDYYALDMEHGSEDPSDPSQTQRVLTVMLASEY